MCGVWPSWQKQRVWLLGKLQQYGIAAEEMEVRMKDDIGDADEAFIPETFVWD